MSAVDVAKRRAQREKRARQEAEKLLEQKSLELYNANQELMAARDDMEARVEDRTQQLSDANEKLLEQMREREELSQQLIALSHEAGRAEVAVGVLHNVGNVLNSVNVSAELCATRLRNSRCSALQKASVLLTSNQDRLAEFLQTDERGQKLPSFIEQVSLALDKERFELLDEVEQLRTNIEHIKEIVQSQQVSARAVGVIESLQMTELVEQSIKVNADSLARHRVELVREFTGELELSSDRNKIVQIFINLLGNAKQAVASRSDGKITVRIFETDDGRVRTEVEDNGSGISHEHLSKIFVYGFTTKADGHGFGLHSCALAAKQLGGSLTADSQGPGCGAVFALTLPKQYSEDSA